MLICTLLLSLIVIFDIRFLTYNLHEGKVMSNLTFCISSDKCQKGLKNVFKQMSQKAQFKKLKLSSGSIFWLFSPLVQIFPYIFIGATSIGHKAIRHYGLKSINMASIDRMPIWPTGFSRVDLAPW